jgi:hypothetical protein
MGKSIRLVLMVALIIGATPIIAGTPPLQILSALPAPNYSATKDRADLDQLTDGVLTAFPPWVKEESVGWTQTTSVLLIAKPDVKQFVSTYSEVRLFASKGIYAGVLPPSRIDAYCAVAGKKWLHTGGVAVDADALSDRSTGWLTVPLSIPCIDRIALVVHSRGPFLMLDEVSLAGEFSNAGQADYRDSGVPVAIDGLMADSKGRLQAQLEHVAREKRSASIGQHHGVLDAWLLPPWGKLAFSPPTDTGGPLSLTLGPGSSPHYVIGIVNADTRSREVQVALRNPELPPVEVFQIMPVMAADGEQVYDPLLPLPHGTLSIPTGSIGYVLVRHAPVQKSGSIRIALSSGADWKQDLGIDVEVPADLPVGGWPVPDVGVWAYSSDTPIWNPESKPQVVEFLRNAGVNVFVVHPASIPQPGMDTDWHQREMKLRADLRLYRGAGQVLLFLGWNMSSPGVPTGDGAGRRSISRWLPRLVTIMEEEGYSYDQWALYPLDEPAGQQLVYLNDISTWLKSANAKVRIYANPGEVSFLDLFPGARLDVLLSKIDVWQPLLGQPSDRLGPVLVRRSAAPWWIYQVGTPPAKTILPQCYRKLAWEAERRGARGFGFWSFSDTGGSRSWDDLDGSRADWAVVYEAQTGIISSRRWEAFRAGIHEYQILGACASLAKAGDQKSRAGCSRLRSVIDSQMEAVSCR